MFYKVVCFLLLLSCSWADRMVTLDESILNGEFVRFERGLVHFKTAFLGVIKVPLLKVRSLDVKNKQFLKFTDHGTHLGYMKFKKNQFYLSAKKDGLKFETILSPRVAVIWPEVKKAPGVLGSEVSHWKRKIAGGFSKKSGNVNESTTHFSFEAKYAFQQIALKFYGSFYETIRDDQISKSEKKLAYDYENKFSEKNQWYIRQAFEKDTIEELTVRSDLATGLGYYFIDKKHVNLRGRVGFLHSYEDFEKKDDRSEPGADVGLSYSHLFKTGIEFKSELSYLPSFGEEQTYRAVHESYTTLPWSFSVNWKFKLGVRHEYDSAPTGDNENLDTRYYSSLELNF